MPRGTMNRARIFARLVRSWISGSKRVKSKTPPKDDLQEDSHEHGRKYDRLSFDQEQATSSPLTDTLRDNLEDAERGHEEIGIVDDQHKSRVVLPSNIEPEIIELERRGEKLEAIVLDQSMAMDWNAILAYKNKIKSYTRELRRIDAIINQLEGKNARALKEGDEYAENKQSTMQIADIINTETIRRVRAEIVDLEYKLKKFSERKRKLLGKLTQAQDISDLSQSNLERTIRCLFEEHDLLEEIDTSDDSETSSQPPFSPVYQSPLSPLAKRPPSPTPTETERRATQQKIWDLSEKVQGLETKLDDWPNYRSGKLEKYVQVLKAGETSDTQTTFDLKLLKESQDTTRELIEAEEEYTRTEQYAREIGVFVDFGEKEEGFGEYDDDGYTISHEEDMVHREYLEWIYGWMKETPDSDAEPDIVGVPKVELDEWHARVVEMEDSVSVREDYKAVGRRRERIDEYREACDSLEISK